MQAIVEWSQAAMWLTPGRLMLVGVWILICAVSAALLLALRTEFVRSKPIYKYAVLSAVAHIVLIALATTIEIVTPSAPGHDGDVVWFELTGDDEITASPSDRTSPEESAAASARAPAAGHPIAAPSLSAEAQENIEARSIIPREPPADVFSDLSTSAVPPTERQTVASNDAVPTPPTPEAPSRVPSSFAVTDQKPAPRLSRESTGYFASPVSGENRSAVATSSLDTKTEPVIDTLPSVEIIELPTQPIVRPVGNSPQMSQPGVRVPTVRDTEAASVLPVRRPIFQSNDVRSASVPELYRLRLDPDKLALAKRFGADEETEQAVRRALAWLASHQEADGSWNPIRHGGGKETYTLGKDRGGAGAQAQTGITALALLAFLGAGHTHRHDGPYRRNVAAAVDFLVRSQAPQGHLAGGARVYEFMYCHAMGTLALAEAYGMTGDPELERPVRRAVAFSLSAQDPRGGGWRYRPGDPGDTSQMGWQLMALRSARLAGIPVPADTFTKAERFLKNVRAGGYGGLASYRPGEPISPAMTAEALVCRQLLGESISTETLREADAFLLQHRPGTGENNLYFWYYASMALYYQQGEAWNTWNRALKDHLLAMQSTTGESAGSWPANTTWGGYGGTVYTTATAALCLEVYYRYLPMYVAIPETNSVLR